MPSAKFSQSRPLTSAVTATATLALLHDYDRLIRCQPLVGPVEKLPSGAPEAITAQIRDESEKSPDHIWYQQTEHVPILPFGLLKKKVVFYNWYKDIPSTSTPALSGVDPGTDMMECKGGVESICYAPSNIKIHAVFRVEKKKRKKQHQHQHQQRESRPDVRKGTVASQADPAASMSGEGNHVLQGTGGGNDNSDMTTSVVPTQLVVQSGDVDDDGDDQGWKIVEETEMSCPNWLILQFSERQHKAAHEKMLDAIVHEAQKSAYVSSSSAAVGNGS